MVVHTTPANIRDETWAIALLDRIPPVQGPRGRPRRKPEAFVGDRGYGFSSVIAQVEAKRIHSLLAPRHAEHGSGLGRFRWVVERTLAWFSNYRRLKLCYEWNGSSFQAFHELAAGLICYNFIERLLWE